MRYGGDGRYGGPCPADGTKRSQTVRTPHPDDRMTPRPNPDPCLGLHTERGVDADGHPILVVTDTPLLLAEAEMSYADFVARYRHIPALPGFDPGWIEERASMLMYRDPVASWDDIPDGSPVFVLWLGGNRGEYVRRGRDLYVPGTREMRTLDPGPFEIGRGRHSNIAWIPG